MKFEIISQNGQEFLKLTLVKFIQAGEEFYLAKIPADAFLKVYTARPAIYDLEKHQAFASLFSEESDYYNELIKLDQEKIESKDFQREYDEARVNKIKQFLLDSEHPFFPNTIISSCDLINDIPDGRIDINSSFEDYIYSGKQNTNLSFLQENEGSHILYVPYRANKVIIIDGQHRLRGLERAPIDYQKNYELIISFIIGYDRSVIAKQFYTINYEQKSVNKSLLYHLTGEFSTEINELTYLHHVAKLLNELENSPLRGRIKMLGVNPKEATAEQRKLLSISQAFLIDALIRTISKTSKNSYLQPIFLKYFEKEEWRIEIIKFLMRYFKAVEGLFPEKWADPAGSVIAKGMGIGALIRVLHFYFSMKLINDWKGDLAMIKQVKSENIQVDLKGLENVNLKEYEGQSSGGTMAKLASDMVVSIDFFGTNNYSDFLQNFKDNYLERVIAAIDKNYFRHSA